MAIKFIVCTLDGLIDFLEESKGRMDSFVSMMIIQQDNPNFSIDDIVQQESDSKKEYKHVFYVLLANEDVVIATCRLIEGPDDVYINMVHVNSDFRRQGFCTKMLTRLFEKIKGVTFRLEVYAANRPAIACYESVGFVGVSEKNGLLVMQTKT